MPAEPIMELRGVDKYFGDLAAVNQINLAFQEGEFFTLVGPSGSGKTTLLRMLAGMDKPTRGDILLRGERINDRPANWRPTCMVFQSLALFPHMTVGGNVELPGTFPPSDFLLRQTGHNLFGWRKTKSRAGKSAGIRS